MKVLREKPLNKDSIESKMIDEYAHLLKDPWFRLNHLYKIVTKNRILLDFKPNNVQRSMFENKHTRNVVLKARQLGSSTFWSIYLLDQALFNDNYRAGIIGYSLDNARSIFRILKTAYDNLPTEIKKLAPLVKETATEIEFAHGSSVKVSTTMRGSTLNALVISELGRTAAHYPAKADEILAGCLNTLPSNAFVVIESTAEGAQGAFYDICESSIPIGSKKQMTDLDWRFHFFPWHCFDEYQMDDSSYEIPDEHTKYFTELRENQAVDLTHLQKVWYSKTALVLQDKIRSEYPSTAKEAFWKNSEAFYYMSNISKAEANDQITRVPWQEHLPVYTSWDLGVTTCSVIFFQVTDAVRVNIIDFYEDSGQGITNFIEEVNKRKYNYGKHFLPHDATNQQGTSGKCYQDYFTDFGLPSEKIKRESIESGITRCKTMFSRLFFDVEKTKKLREHLINYRRRWNENLSMYSDTPVGDEHSHASDSLRYLCRAVEILQHQPNEEELKRLRRWNESEHLRRW